MGMFKKAKEAMAAGQSAAAGAGSMPGMPDMASMTGGADMGAMAAMSAKINKLAASGVEAPGKILAIRAVGQPDISGATLHQIDVTITPSGGAPYDCQIDQSLLPQQMTGLEVGKDVTVKYDPDNPTSALLHSW